MRWNQLPALRAWTAALIGLNALGAIPLAGVAIADPAGFAFLKVPAGARASAMGGAYSSVADGVEAIWWNPAGLAGADGVQVAASHDEYLASLRMDEFAVGGRMLGGGASASVRALYSEPIPERDAIGNLIGTFGSHDLSFALGYGRSAGAGWRLGANAQLVRERVADASAMTWAMGLGASWDPAGLKGLRASADLHDIGPAAHYTISGSAGAPVGLPRGARLGVSYARPLGELRALAALETSMSAGQAGITMLGAELSHPVGLALRGGFRWGDTESALAFGAGWTVRRLHLDYAFVPFRSDLGDTHRFSLATQF